MTVASPLQRQDFTLLVNSSDGFVDCWPPFFRLLDVHWPGFDRPILLNTETRDWPDGADRVVVSRVARDSERRLTWSECLIAAIDQVTTPLLLYFQEDYFLDRVVRMDVVEHAVALMLANPDIGHIGLTRHGSFGPYAPYPFEGFSRIDQKARYRISTQAGLWRPDVLRKYLDPVENGWMFEILGTRRAHRALDLFLMADFDETRGGPAIDYTHTGIIKGQWHPDMPALFARHGIDVDFDRRGMYKAPHPLLRRWAVMQRLMQKPLHVARQLF